MCCNVTYVLYYNVGNNTETFGLPDIAIHSFGPAAMCIYQANYSCPCYNYGLKYLGADS